MSSGNNTSQTSESVLHTAPTMSEQSSFKIVRVKKPDGTIVRMKVPMNATPTTPSSAIVTSKPTAALPAIVSSSVPSELKSATVTAHSTQAAAVEDSGPSDRHATSESAIIPIKKLYGTAVDAEAATPKAPTVSEFVRIRKPDGSIVRVRRPPPATSCTVPQPSHASALVDAAPPLLPGPNVSRASTLVSVAPVGFSQSFASASAKQTNVVSVPAATRVTEHASTNGRKAAGVVGHLYTALRTAVSLYPTDIVSRDDLDHDHELHSEDNDHGSDRAGDDNEHSGEGSSINQQADEENAAKGASKVVAGYASSKVITAKASVYKPGAEPDPETRISAAPGNPPMSTSEGTKPPATDSKTIVQVSEKEIRDHDECKVEGQTAKLRGKDPSTLGRRTTRLAQGAAWGIALLFPTFFLVLAVLNASLEAKPLSAFGARVAAADKIAVSIWPILFGAVVAQSLKVYAAWKVERGIKLVTLEQLSGSHSLASALKQPFFLQTINWTAILLICLWALSPLAGQSFIRMLGQEGHTITNSSQVSYVRTNDTPYYLDDTNKHRAARLAEPELDSVFSVALLSFIDKPQYPKDPWSNVLVPSLDAADDKVADKYSRYTSFVGLSVSSTPANASTAIEIPYSYFTLDECSYNQNTTIAAINKSTKWPPRWGNQFNNGADELQPFEFYTDERYETWMAILPRPDARSDIAGQFYFAMNYSMIMQGPLEPDSDFFDVVFLNCTYSSRHVVVNLTCSGPGICVIDSVQNNTNPVLSPTFPNMTVSLISELVNSLGDPYINAGSLITRFIIDPATTFSLDENHWLTDIHNLDPNSVRSRIQLLLNSFWLTAYAPDLRIQNPWSAKTGFGSEESNEVGNITATTTYSYPVYVIHWGWLTVLLASSCGLIVAGVAGIILEIHTVGPDILGFASSLTRDNRYMKIASSSSLEGGAERTRSLRNHMVMLQDVHPQREIGRIALGSLEDGAESNRLRPGRLYV